MFQKQLQANLETIKDNSQQHYPFYPSNHIDQIQKSVKFSYGLTAPSSSRSYVSDTKIFTSARLQNNRPLKNEGYNYHCKTSPDDGQLSRIRTRKIFQKKVMNRNLLDPNFRIIYYGPIQVTCRKNYNQYQRSCSPQSPKSPERNLSTNGYTRKMSQNKKCHNAYPQSLNNTCNSDYQSKKQNQAKITDFCNFQQSVTIGKKQQNTEIKEITNVIVNMNEKQNKKSQKYVTFKLIDQSIGNRILDDGIIASFDKDIEDIQQKQIKIVQSQPNKNFNKNQKIKQVKNTWVLGACAISLIIIIILLIYS